MINPTEAPEGYEAVADVSGMCSLCAMFHRDAPGVDWACRAPVESPSCLPLDREDNESVIFIKKVIPA
jgi:hypothetical protein